MKALLDQNLPLCPDSLHVRELGLTGDDDERIWAIAKKEGFVIFTKDNDFLARALVRGHPPQVVQICVGNASTRHIANLLGEKADEIERFVTENKESVFLLRP